MHACRYNLRGLRRDGRCPECGEWIVETLRVLLARQQVGVPLVRSNPAWIRSLFEGTIWLLMPVLITIFIASVPFEWYWPKTQGQKTILGLAVTSFVCQWFGVWKMTRREPGSIEIGFVRMAARVGATALLCIPFMTPLFSLNVNQFEEIAILSIFGAILLAIVGTVAFWWYVRQIASRLSAPTVSIIASVLAFAAPIWFVGSVIPTSFHGRNETFEHSPSVVFGAPGIFIHTVHLVRSNPGPPDALLVIGSLLPILSAGVVIQLCLALSTALRVKPATIAERTEPSSGSSPH